MYVCRCTEPLFRAYLLKYKTTFHSSHTLFYYSQIQERNVTFKSTIANPTCKIKKFHFRLSVTWMKSGKIVFSWHTVKLPPTLSFIENIITWAFISQWFINLMNPVSEAFCIFENGVNLDNTMLLFSFHSWGILRYSRDTSETSGYFIISWLVQRGQLCISHMLQVLLKDLLKSSFKSLYLIIKSSIYFFCSLGIIVHSSCLLQITDQGFMKHSANEQLPPIGSCYRGTHEHLSIICIHLSHHWLIRMNLLDLNDLWKTWQNIAN